MDFGRFPSPYADLGLFGMFSLFGAFSKRRGSTAHMKIYEVVSGDLSTSPHGADFDETSSFFRAKEKR
jgi:hypothetical protein